MLHFEIRKHILKFPRLNSKTEKLLFTYNLMLKICSCPELQIIYIIIIHYENNLINVQIHFFIVL